MTSPFPGPRAGVTKVGCLVGLLLFAAVFYFGLPAGQAYWRSTQYRNAMREEIRFRSDQSDEQIQTRLQAVADSLGLPEEAGVVTIDRQSKGLTIQASYDEIWKLPGYEKRLRFEPSASGSF